MEEKDIVKKIEKQLNTMSEDAKSEISELKKMVEALSSKVELLEKENLSLSGTTVESLKKSVVDNADAIKESTDILEQVVSNKKILESVSKESKTNKQAIEMSVDILKQVKTNKEAIDIAGDILEQVSINKKAVDMMTDILESISESKKDEKPKKEESGEDESGEGEADKESDKEKSDEDKKKAKKASKKDLNGKESVSGIVPGANKVVGVTGSLSEALENDFESLMEKINL